MVMLEVKETHTDIIRELANIGIGQGANILNNILESHISLTSPEIKIIDKEEILKFSYSKKTNKFCSVQMRFTNHISGLATLIFPSCDAAKLVSIFTNEVDSIDTLQMDALKKGVLTEVGNIVINAIIGTISNQLKLSLNYSIPEYCENRLWLDIVKKSEKDKSIGILSQTQFSIKEHSINGEFIILFSDETYIDFFKLIDEYYYNYMNL